MAKFAKALDRRATVGWGDSWVDLEQQRASLDLIITNGAIPVTNLKKDTAADAGARRTSATRSSRTRAASSSQTACRRSSAAGSRPPTSPTTAGWASPSTRSTARSFCSQNTGKVGNWLEVSLKGFHPGALVTAQLPNGHEARRRAPRRQQLPLVGGSAGALRARHGDEGRPPDDPLPERDDEGAHRRRGESHPDVRLRKRAPRVGLEPTTCRLTAGCSAN